MTKRYATYSWSAREALTRREPFNTYGAFRAIEGATGGYANTGRLPEPYDTAYRETAVEGRITYTVLSYRTPIAWVLDDGQVIIPDVKYSITTTGHQGLLYALKQPVDGPLADAAQSERQAARERAAQQRAERPHPVVTELREPTPTRPERVDYAPVRMEYSESYSVRQGWATSYDRGPASGVYQEL